MIDRKIEQIIQEVSKNKRNFKKEKKLVSNGYLDSFSVLLLISRLEQQFKIKINMKYLDINNFESINLIKKIIKGNKKK
jgi:acyl carrier protein|tara:strand:- start:751 stop:987 length:237 start_codon:yes stop_codon:yes gene_type:complete